MRSKREKDAPESKSAYYHLITRAVAGEFVFRDTEKEVLRKHLWLVADRCGIEVLTYCVMSNHLHIVVHAPKRVPLSDDELLRRYTLLRREDCEWEQLDVRAIRALLAQNGEAAAGWRAREMRKMGDISEYMKLLKQRFSIWFNKSHGRFGTLWAERFRSVLIEPGALIARIAAYGDLNPLRAGLCRDPKDYRFCGYAEAVAGSERARRGIQHAMGAANWNEAQRLYRMLLYEHAARPSDGKASLPDTHYEQVVAQKGNLSLSEELRCRCRYFTLGAVLGSAAFVQDRIEKLRALTGRCTKMVPNLANGAAAGFTSLRKIRNAPALI